MLAAVCPRYGGADVIEIATVPTPVPQAHQVLIQVYATTVSVADARIRGLRMPVGFGWLARPIFGWSRPRQPILGTELAGQIVAVGQEVKKFKPGERVVAFPGATMGGHGEWVVLAADSAIVPLPASIDWTTAAALSFGGTTALYFLRHRLELQPNERVLIVGGSGAVGSAAIQIAKIMQCHVTAIASGQRQALMSRLGADVVLDYQQPDHWPSHERFDAILDTIGQMGWSELAPLLTAKGRIALVAANVPQMLGGMWGAALARKKLAMGPAPESANDIEQLVQWAAQNLYRPVLDSVYPLQEIRKAYAVVDTGHKQGSVVILMPITQAPSTS